MINGKSIVSSVLQCCIVAFCLLLNTLVYGQFSRSDETIATTMYTAIVNTNWNTPSKFETLKIGILDKDQNFFEKAKKIFNGVKYQGKKLEVFYIESVDKIKAVQVLFVDKRFNKNIDNITEKVKDNEVLLITNLLKDPLIAMVDMKGALKKEKFEVNVLNINKAGLTLSKNMTAFISGDLSWESLYNEAQKELLEARGQLSDKELLILQQQKTIEGQKNTLKKNLKLLAAQDQLLKKRSQSILDQKKQLRDQAYKIGVQTSQMRYQRKEITKQEAKLIHLFKTINTQRWLLISGVLLLVLGLLFALFALRTARKKQKMTDLLSVQKSEIIRQKEELILNHQQITTILGNLHASIGYGLRIQNAILPSGSHISTSLNCEHFVFSKPKDIVSGDFYFVQSKGDWVLTAVADCTGHGVPGAFMSMLCISLLNDYLRTNDELNAGEILNNLRIEIIKLLHQENEENQSRDGMDISLLLMNKNKKEAQWAGANSSLVMFDENGAMTELRPDKQPVAIYPRMENFTNHQIDLKKGDMLYMFSDGYVDQFGGPEGKKFMKRNLYSIFDEINKESVSNQSQKIEKVFQEWLNGATPAYEQIDDVTLMGIRID